MAVYAYFDGASRLPEPDASNIFIESYQHGWTWNIPLADDRASVGIVVDSESGQRGVNPTRSERLLRQPAKFRAPLRPDAHRRPHDRPAPRHKRLVLHLRPHDRRRLDTRRRCCLLHRPSLLLRRPPRHDVRCHGRRLRQGHQDRPLHAPGPPPASTSSYTAKNTDTSANSPASSTPATAPSSHTSGKPAA